MVENLNEIRRLLTERGVEVLLCSLFLSEELQLEDPQRDRVRREINQQLKHRGSRCGVATPLWWERLRLNNP